MSVNKVILLGNLGKDPELRYTASQIPVCSFSMATNERRKDQSGNWSDHTEWHNIVTFGKTAENCAQYLKKGRQVYVEGRLQTRKWEDKEGRARYTTEVLANTVQFIGSRADEAVEKTSSALDSVKPADEVAAAAVAAGAEDITFDDDDIPF
ncbi:MAG: single-stranded DNA-binding protein [Candidatus Dadabacteria bacterium]|nr:MAG: single-stranded DNA-binding protein [Candidatus Dadabacteria bacterium]